VPAKPIRTLLVEDNPGDRRLIVELLKEGGDAFETVAFESLGDAIVELGRGDFDVAITDLNLPDSAGLETYTSLQEAAVDLPIVVLTGYADEAFATGAVQKGAQDYLIKGKVDYGLLARSIRYAIERKHAEETLRRLNEELDRRVVARTEELANSVRRLKREIQVRKRAEGLKDEFLDMVSHELRTPLAISGEGISLVLDGATGELAAEQTRLLQIAKRNLDRLGRLINNLLDISRIEAGKMEVRKQPVELCGVIRELVASFHVRAAGKGLDLTAEFTDDPIHITADSDCIAEIMTNLLGNAIKYTEKGSVVVELCDGGREIQCVVSDTGVGIASEHISKVFDKFEQFHRQPGGGEKGTGLGLAITKNIVEHHGGRIWVDSEPETGSRFTFTIPKHG